MKTFVVSLCALVLVACAVETEQEPEPHIAIVSEELKGGVDVGPGAGFGLDPYGDCLTDCSYQKAACERRNLQIITDQFELAEPCDLEYSMCKARCDRTFPAKAAP